MRTYLLIAFTLLLFVAVGCDGNSNPSSATHDTIWVVDSSRLNASYPLHGRIVLQKNCEHEANHGGVLVTMVSTGETTITDDSGYYSFPRYTYPRKGVEALRFSKDGFYPASIPIYELNANRDSEAYLVNSKLFRYVNYSASFIGEPRIDSQMALVTKDTLMLNDDDVLIKKQIVTDTIFYYYHTFKAVALDDKDQKTSLAPVFLMISKTPTFNHLDPSTYVAMRSTPSYPASFTIAAYQLDYLGIKTGDTVYVSVTSTGECMTELTPGLRKSEPIRVILR